MVLKNITVVKLCWIENSAKPRFPDDRVLILLHYAKSNRDDTRSNVKVSSFPWDLQNYNIEGSEA